MRVSFKTIIQDLLDGRMVGSQCISRAEAVELALSIVCSEDFQRILSEDYKRAYENGVKCAEGSRRHHP